MWRKDKDQKTETSDPESETQESDNETPICIYCKYHRLNEEGYDHACFANATEEMNYITGEKHWTEVEDCEDQNSDGDCSDFKKLS